MLHLLVVYCVLFFMHITVDVIDFRAHNLYGEVI